MQVVLGGSSAAAALDMISLGFLPPLVASTAPAAETCLRAILCTPRAVTAALSRHRGGAAASAAAGAASTFYNATTMHSLSGNHATLPNLAQDLATFLLLRNLTPALRAVHLRLFAWLGELSLELYILQFPVWLAEDAKKLVVALPAFRGVSFLVATAAFVALAWASSAATGLAMKHIEAQGRSAVLGAAAALLLVMCGINVLGPRSCSMGGAGG
jgi:peptidoglycan/LPS O-acetylase OafA/YrhL